MQQKKSGYFPNAAKTAFQRACSSDEAETV
jgi:hypothetical protein